MKRRSDIRKAQQVVAIRDVQRIRAESHLAAATLKLTGLQAEQEDATAALAEVHSAWTTSISGARVDLELASGWSTAVLSGIDELAAVGVQVTQAQELRQGRGRELVAAMARADAADTIARQVRAAVARREEEAALSAVADRYAQRSTAP